MNIRSLCHLGLAIAALLLAGCDDESGKPAQPPGDDFAMTEEKYRLVDMAIDAVVAAAYMPGQGQLVVSDLTAMNYQAERYMEADDTLNAITALDIVFPYEFLAWTQEESDLAFAGYYKANREPVNVTLEGLGVLDRDVVLLMPEQYKEYMAEDEYLGWAEFYADHPDAVGYLRIGNPAVFHDTGIALVHVDYVCDTICGISFFALFRREGEEWVFDNWYADWAS